MTTRHTAIAATLVLTLTAVPSAAQTTIHVSGGLNRATVSIGADWVMRAVAGAALSFPVSERLNLQLGTDYSQKGFGAGATGVASFSAHTGYLEASVLLDVALGGGEGVSMHLLVGPTFGLNISCEVEFMAPRACREARWIVTTRTCPATSPTARTGASSEGSAEGSESPTEWTSLSVPSTTSVS